MNNYYQPEYANNGLTLVHIPEEFEGEYVIPEGVREIADSAFIECTNLTAVKFPTTLERIGEYAFKLCESLKSIDIPDSVTEIGQYAFWMCHSLSKVRLSANLSRIKSNTFSETAIEEIEIPKSVKLIEDQAFGDCYDLQDVRLPDNIEIADSAFEGCNCLNAADAIYLNLYGNPHYKLVKVFPHAFHYSIPDDVVEIGGNVLEDCDNIESIVIPDSVKIIHEGAFSGSKIKMIKIGKGVASLPDSCFGGCESLEEIDIPDHISSIGGGCFCKCSKIKTIKIGKSMTSLPDSCFSGCESLEEFDVPAHISSIGQSCFSNCGNIKSIRMSDAVISLGANSFGGCTNLQSIKLSNSIETIPEETFAGCSSIKEISLPQSVKTIEKKAFYGCNNLQNINLGNSVETICEEAFEGCSKLTKISLPQSLKTIDKMAFYGCSSLENVEYSDKVSIGIDAFLGTLVKDSYLFPEFKYYSKMLPSQWKSDTPSGNTMLKVYRGISVENADIAEQLIKDIKENGLYLEQITEKYKVSKYKHKECRGHNKLTKEELDKLYSNKLPLETALEGKDDNQVYFGDYICAMNYAVNQWSPSSIPIIIEAEMPLDELNVDGVDSFVHIFNSYCDNGLVREVFGEKIEMYYEKYRAEVNIFDGKEALIFREAIINMAESDNDIVYAFYKNNRVIGGKWGNIFKCAFQAKLPISPDRILSVKVVSKESRPNADIYLGDFR